MTTPLVHIAGRPIGPGHPPYIVAEMSGNHNGELARAIKLIEAAADAGADAVKLQTYTADTITIDHDGPGFVLTDGLWKGRKLYDLYREAHTPWDWHPELFDAARRNNIAAFSSPFDSTAVEFLETLDAPAYKIASFEAVDLPLIRQAARTGKPMIISTGMANLEEIEEAVTAARSEANNELILLHCVSGYPTPAEEIQLATIPDLAAKFDAVIGLSDHSLGTAVSVAAVALGACFIEKHFTLARDDGGPDAAFSLEPDELARLASDCRTAWAALGAAGYDRKSSESAVGDLRRSLYAVADINAGETLTEENVRSIRPGFGLAPKYFDEILGRRAGRPISRGTPLSFEDLAETK